MPNIKSAAKRLRQSEKRRLRNRAAKSRIKTAIKRVQQAIEMGDIELANISLREAVSIINKTAQKGIIHANKAARLTSSLTRKVNAFLSAKKDTSQPQNASP